MAKGQYFHVGPTNECFTIQPFTRTDTCLFPSSANDVRFLSRTSANQLAAVFDNPAIPAPQPKQCQNEHRHKHIFPSWRGHALNVQAIRRSDNKRNTSQGGGMGFACTCLRRRSMPTLPPMCYHVERVNNRKPTTLQTTKGQCFQLDPTNECFAIRPFTRNRSCVTEGRWQRTKSRPPCKKTRGQLSGRPDQCYHRALHTKRHFPVGHRLTFCWREADVSRAHKKRGRWDKNAPGQKTSKPTQMRVRHSPLYLFLAHARGEPSSQRVRSATQARTHKGTRRSTLHFLLERHWLAAKARQVSKECGR